MIDLSDEACLPRGVTFRNGYLCDEVLQQSYPINGTAATFLKFFDKRRQIGSVASSVSGAYGLPLDVVAHDLVAFVSRLNSVHLMNVTPRGIAARLRMAHYVATQLLVSRTLPPLFVMRHPVSNSGWLSLIATITSALVRHLLPVWMMPAILLLGLGLALPAPFLLMSSVTLVTVFGCLIVHEIGHGVAVKAARGRSYLVTAGWQAGITHSIAKPPALVHAAGVLFAGTAGILMVFAGHLTGNAVLVEVAFPFFLNWGGLTVATKDGRSLATALFTGG